MNLSKKQTIRLTLTIISTIIFITAFVINITLNQAIYNVDLNNIPILQNAVSSGFIIFMNLVSYVLTPTYCAGYIALIWLFSSKKMEILVFILWFIFMNWLNSIIKTSIQQPRPYWIQGSGIKMLSWHCYSQYGCPSGHSMMGLLFLQFLVRFTIRSFKGAKKISWFLYIIMAFIQLLLMFSRVILGMHTINQVLMGAMISIYGIFLYYAYLQTIILNYLTVLSITKRQMLHLTIILGIMLLFYALEIMLLFLPSYYDANYYQIIVNTTGCSHAHYSNSFQYSCFEGTALIMVNFGALISLTFFNNPQKFTKPLKYPIFSWKFLLRYIILGVAAMIPIGIFYLNHAWGKIKSDTIGKTFISWSTQSVGFFFTSVMVFFVGLPISAKIDLQIYGKCLYPQLISIAEVQYQINSQSEIQLTPQRSKERS